MKELTGGVAAAKGFTAAGIHCGVKNKNAGKKDLALIVSDCPCAAAGVYTRNRVKADPVFVTMENLRSGSARAVVCNSGNANACAPNGRENALRMCEAAAAALHIAPEEVAVASTGVIGKTLDIAAVEAGIPLAAAALSRDGSEDAAQAIMTTDTVKKELALSLTLGGKPVVLGGIAKGSGMIHPNMGTMLCFITSDVNISADLLAEALSDNT
ncbi:MAG: bifunctional ornithine acetyltransferase/N-acetylglutamate synthase, partial [Oscillospiraceae bacterium]|nr:bifunctional ornithine acetyltransferase/N-acetylglutamate synthase [Oscillospiraceae bacterium]